MANKYFVYTLFFSRTQQNAFRFLCFQKRALGYYFSSANAQGGVIIPDGMPLKAAAKFALPGGEFEGGDWTDNAKVLADCQRECTEECGRLMSFLPRDQIVAGHADAEDVIVPVIATLKKWGVNLRSVKGYAAMYVNVPDASLADVARYIQACFDERDEAVAKIVNGDWDTGDYAQLAAAYPQAPMDDEIHLERPPIYTIASGGFRDDPLIAQLAGDSDTDWFAEIIRGLETIDL